MRLRARLDPAAFEPLLLNPERGIEGKAGGSAYRARIAIPGYGERVARHYAGLLGSGLAAACADAEIPFTLPHFGLVLEFAAPTEFALHDEAMILDETIRGLVGRFGPVVLRNAYIDGSVRNRCHRNIFPHLRFHFDRGPNQPNQVSCFTRDPFDQEQRQPRASSTLFLANIVAWLELVQTGKRKRQGDPGVPASCDLFEGANMVSLLGEIVFEQPWSEPEGTGEIVVIDNRTVLHATYHKDGRNEGYRIGARYLG